MSRRGKLELNRGNVQSELLRNPAIEAIVERKAREIMDAAIDLSGIADGYTLEKRPYGTTRMGVKVTTEGQYSFSENMEHNTLLKAKGRVKE